MKIFDTKKIERSLEDLKELSEELKKEIATNQSYYGKLTGISRQHLNSFIHGKSNFSVKKLLYIYKIIQGQEKW
jgi:DNA-binding transcriptional regulator YdaS (Cro superfamily)